MSSPPRNPENAAPATLVSPAHSSSTPSAALDLGAIDSSTSSASPGPAQPVPAPAAAAADPGAPATDIAAAQHAQQDQQQQQQQQQQSQSPPVPAQASQDTPPAHAAAPPPATSAVTQKHQQDVSSHVDPNIKKPRPPIALPRQSGPSLLTQALASARGIPSRTHSHNDQSSSQVSTRSLPSPTADSVPTNPLSAAGLDPVAVDPRHVPSHVGHGASVGPRSAPQPGFVVPPAPINTTSIPSAPPADAATADMEIMTSPTYDMASFQGIRAMLLDHRDFLRTTRSRGRGTSLERVEREPKVQEGVRKNRAHSHSTSPDGSLTTSVAQLDQRLQENIDTDVRPKKLEHRFSLGPEKIWSIGSSEAIDGQEDGQVEKSVHEAMIGAEPNARSRKASYSLRFFREGLPKEDKTRRKDARHTHMREKISPSQEGQSGLSADIAIEDFAAKSVSTNPTPSPRILDKKDWLPKQLERVKTFPLQSPQAGNTPILTDSPTQDYFGLRKVNGDIFHKVDSDGTVQIGLKEDSSDGQASPTTVEEGRQVEARRPSDSSEHGESHEEGDESSEEKISSAVFVPHPGLEEAAERERDVSKPRQTPGNRTASRAEDFHPWLVKADEPEPEEEPSPDQPPDTPSHRPKPKRLPIAPNVALREVQPGKIEDFAVDDEPEPPTPKPVTTYFEDHAHHHQTDEKEPLEAIELIPYKHQVGGHTTLWRFSKRAVCKQLNNRENEFYEKVEQHHRDLLTFLPRYIGVLNVTFHKQPRRKSTHKREDAGLLERKHTGENGAVASTEQSKSNSSNGAALGNPNSTSQGNTEHRRIISQSLASGPVPIPTVTFDDNWHILPRNLFQPTPPPAGIPLRGRSTSSSGLPDNSDHGKMTSPTRPSLDDRHANSWGATTVNKRLRNEVFNDAFLKQPIPIHKHRRPHQKSMAFRKQQALRPANSVPDLIRRQETAAPEAHAPHNSSPLRPSSASPPGASMPIERPGQEEPTEADDSDVKDVTGTSAPEPETLADKIIAQKKKRRYSGTGLRRKPRTVTESRGNLKYWEEADDAGYRGEDEGQSGSVTTSQVNSPMIEPPTPNGKISNGGPAKELSLPMAATDVTQPEVPREEHSTYPSTAPSEVPSPTQEFRKIPRPVNPKEAQTQRNSRVEYFLLLEDLTAGMKRPCIMDLKMGTRQYGVDATPKKQKSQQGKCARTTSRELGVRVCGLQVWDVKSQSYVFKDKYFGRDLKAGQEFQDALTRFLYDGVDYSSILRHIPTILHKLDKLESIVRKLDGYRFYAASLLMFYDGDTSEGNEYDTVVDESTTDFATDTEETSALREKRKRKNKREIDFKIADFANSLTKGDLAEGKPCPPQHPNEPDRGFLRGLRTLRKYFLKIQRDIRADMGLDPMGRSNRMDVDIDIDLEHISDDEGPVSE
ncbi:inositol hexaphosphate kinase kcs1 [Colletotrichum truncatum]|uniref:Inositol hexaphosphate kinase kcs1 n=1 Tax=Colletotrichum truncatum TaxID=5467 RepID=A0ACC3Z8I4_COLTU|nr:inositol hexaphosphate kinase kcs1 [Colletotrichum truncatum]KAF6789224.1 inositol hexaphosphate kinase kcs1 [Colletotrichum truncatum]